MDKEEQLVEWLIEETESENIKWEKYIDTNDSIEYRSWTDINEKSVYVRREGTIYKLRIGDLYKDNFVAETFHPKNVGKLFNLIHERRQPEEGWAEDWIDEVIENE
jgi:hypothetical protein